MIIGKADGTKKSNTYNDLIFHDIPSDKLRRDYHYQLKNYIYADFNDNLPQTNLQDKDISAIVKDFQYYDGTNQSDEVLTNNLVELYRRLKDGENAYCVDKIKFISPEENQGLLGVHYWANCESKKMAIYVYNPKTFYEKIFKHAQHYNKYNVGVCALSSMIHETQHDTQSANVLKAMKGEKIAPADRVASAIMLSSTIGLLEIPYRHQYIEFEANWKACKTMFNFYKEGKLDDDYNNKLQLYSDLIDVLCFPKENVINDNLQYLDNSIEKLQSINDPEINNLVRGIDNNAVEEFKNQIRERHAELDKMRKELEKELIEKMTPEMKINIDKLRQRNAGNNQVDNDCIEHAKQNDTFEYRKCSSVLAYLGAGYYKTYLAESKNKAKKVRLSKKAPSVESFGLIK